MLSNDKKGGLPITFVQLRAKTTDGAIPGFYKQVKPEGADKWQDGDVFSTIGPAQLISVTPSSYETTEHGVKRTVEFRFSDGEAVVQVEANMSGLSRSIINSLANATLGSMSDITIEIWQKDGFANASVYENGKKVDWAVEWKDQPKPEEMTFKGKTYKDYEAPDNFFYELAKEKISPRLAEVATPTEGKAENPADTPVDPAPSRAMDAVPADDDLPF